MQIRAATLFIALLAGGCAYGSGSGRSGGIVTLVPSFADDLYALGAGRQLAAVSAFTDDPKASALPRVADSSSVDAEAIVALRPSLVIGIPSQARLVEPLRRAHLRVVLLSDDGYDRIFTNLLTIGALAGRRPEAAGLVARLARETAKLHARTFRFAWHPRVFIVLDSAPVWTAGSGSYISKLVTIAGGRNAAADLGAAYAPYSSEALLEDRPDVLIADRATHLQAVLDREPWHSLQAVRLHRVYSIDSDLLERPGPRYNDAIRWLVDRLSPIATRSKR
ncbi:MAG TPA: ABC transporter substrate-binding protein [Candidatus Cybelea sp.]|nr:ABC transporter substrate-binding protein [Candidatus Cybelea sp.]